MIHNVHPSAVPAVREPGPWHVRVAYGPRVEIVRETIYGASLALSIPVPAGYDPAAVAAATSCYAWQVRVGER